ncbi:uncharacterized protein LOC123547963 [Mercenaria mercenaria]|uniref:uncharacterized protein LOC123547963 n=1 Tax=Mercenaria mercenaria TaxID=6596 RepID=UPI00234EBAD3|nr:uncharacterized protein LOC123547963 [Mercenaria mercenaria]
MTGKRSILLFIAFLCVFLFVSFARGSRKKGVAAWAGDFRCDDFKVLNNLSWWYDWKNDLTTYDAHVTNVCPASNVAVPQFIPMVWKSKWDNRTHLNFTRHTHFVLGYNEPDREDQANLTPQQVADIWPDIEKQSHGRLLVSPAVAVHDFKWYDEFFRLCNNCRIDHIAAHAYSCNANHIMSYLEKLYHRYHKKIWLTEFACPHATDDQPQLHLMQTLLPKLEAANYVFRYAWFMARVKRVFGDGFINPAAGLLRNDSSTLTRIGHFYNNFHAHGHNPQVVG